MKSWSSSKARAQLSTLLDAAERGEPVVIERRGALFELRARRPAPGRRAAGPRLFEWDDEAIEAGNWTWQSGPDGLEFAARAPRKP